MNDLWRDEAIRRFPELAETFRTVENPYQLWIELWPVFEDAYDSGNAAKVADIYAFAQWSQTQPRGKTAADDLGTCVNVCFIEHIPTHPKALEDMPRWFTIQDVRRLEAPLSYLVGAEGYKRILARYAV